MPRTAPPGADANFVMTDSGGLVEVQGSAEGATFSRAQFDALLDLAERGTVGAGRGAAGGGGVSRRLVEPRLVVATHNRGKLAEIRALIGDRPVALVSAGELGLPEPAETEASFLGNARIKAHAAARATACRRWPTTAASRSTRSAARPGCIPPTGRRRRRGATSCMR